MIQSPAHTIFYTIERAIKEYRRFAQKNLNEKIANITIDQALVLVSINNHPELSQNEISELIFKDNASVTRMIELMTKKGYLKRSINTKDRRKYTLELTVEGNNILKDINSIIANNRKVALDAITENELSQLKTILEKIIKNCNYEEED